nr:hypothetical protein [Pandoravirus belohorizontensis]
MTRARTKSKTKERRSGRLLKDRRRIRPEATFSLTAERGTRAGRATGALAGRRLEGRRDGGRAPKCGVAQERACACAQTETQALSWICRSACAAVSAGRCLLSAFFLCLFPEKIASWVFCRGGALLFPACHSGR